MPLKLSAATVQEALDRADSRHWTRNPPRSTRARTNFLLARCNGNRAALAKLLGTSTTALDAIGAQQALPPSDPLLQALERTVIRLWQPRVRHRAHAAILRNNGQMMVSFRAWLGFTAAAGSSDDPRLRFLTLSLQPPYIERLFTARHDQAPEEELRRILGDALGACYFHRNRPASPAESVSLERIDFVEFYY